MAGPAHDIQILCVCTHNRTRSVMMAALLGGHLEAVGINASVTSAGLHRDANPATDGAIRQMALRGYDVRWHVGHRINRDDVEDTDLILTAEVLHVAEIAGIWHDTFERAFTLPEFVANTDESPQGLTLPGLLERINVGRPTALDYLDARIGELHDPTGEGPAQWEASVERIDDLTGRVAAKLATLDLVGTDRAIGCQTQDG
uniref:arsenate reductase/protein-tyrosine-phosphatase family protein n=1 Tax=Ilumatobacter nonamiensis TaxID=467093 RepID=UPI00058D272B